ncbi:MAG: PH domain-containing protein [Eubacteriales bacterium]|nr:PH domain-containing protein [Eubacteriales bacterium]
MMNFTSSADMYQHCLSNNLCGTASRNTAIKNFELALESLDRDEQITGIFVALYGFKSALSHLGEYAFVITNRRILMTQKQLMQKKVKSLSLENINNISLWKSGLWGTITIDTIKEKLVIGCGSQHVQAVHDEIQNALNSSKSVSSINPSSNDNPIEKVKQLKELLDMGILTPDEFDKKKRELLGL